MPSAVRVPMWSCVLLVCALGCSNVAETRYETRASDHADAADDRLLVRTGTLTVEVGDPDSAALQVEALVSQAGGYVERSDSKGQTAVSLRLRVPAERLDEIMRAVAALGDVQSRTLGSVDVTEQHDDLDVRIRNATALRDRLQELLARADDVSDVLAVEKELTRVQSELESMQARLERLDRDVQLSALSVTLERERILGPLGYVFYGVGWVFKKLFVIH